MADSDSHETRRRVSRRRFVKAASGTGAAVGLAGCVSFNGGGDGGGGGGDGEMGNGGGGNNTEPISMEEPSESITVQWAADSRAKENAQAYKDALSKAGLSDKINLEIVAGSQVTDNRQSQYQQWLSSGREQPTLLMMDSGWTIPFIARNQILNLSQALPKEMTKQVEESYFEASVATAKGNDGDLYGIPLFPDFPTIQYRKDLVEEAGYDPEGENWATESMDWAKFSKVTKDVMEKTDVGTGFTFQADSYEGLSCCDFNEFMTSYGGAYFGDHENLFGPIGDRPVTVDEQPVIDSIKMVRTLIHGEDDEHSLDGITGNIAPEAVVQWTEEPSRKPFTNGDVVMHRNWPYSIVINGAEDVFGEDLGVMPIPQGVKQSEAKYEGTGGPVAALGGWHMTINPNAPPEKKSAGAQVIKAMMQESFKMDIFSAVGWIPPEPDLLKSDEAKEVDVIGRYVDSLAVAGENAVPRPVTVVWPQQSSQIASKVNSTYAGNVAPEKAMSDLKSTLEDIESKAN